MHILLSLPELFAYVSLHCK